TFTSTENCRYFRPTHSGTLAPDRHGVLRIWWSQLFPQHNSLSREERPGDCRSEGTDVCSLILPHHSCFESEGCGTVRGGLCIATLESKMDQRKSLSAFSDSRVLSPNLRRFARGAPYSCDVPWGRSTR